MAYTTIPTLTDTVLTAASFNAYLRDNQLALKDPPSANYEANESADYSSSSTTFADVDSSHYSHTISITGTEVIVGFVGSCIGTGAVELSLDLSVDGVQIANSTGRGLASSQASGITVVSFYRLITGLSVGSHTFKLRFAQRSASGSPVLIYAGAGSAGRDVHPQFWVRELS